ncbi:MAG: formate dehydrogenase accessory sulfurtransferase FdhD [Oscillospiraceae bacterium]|nr:formate dehydrogenase accessory sulfurtransferase FdhD [Oscillospiraceae bacterium]
MAKIIAPVEPKLNQRPLTMDYIPVSGCPASGDKALLVEHEMEVFINDTLTYRLTCSPNQLPELVLGRLLSEGVISRMEDVEILYLCQEGQRARVFLTAAKSATGTEPYVETVPSCCTGNRTFSHCFADGREPAPLHPIPYDPAWIFALSRAIDSDTPLYAMTRSAHSCILMRQGEILVCSEDIGRHNAMDKALGWALLHQVPLSECILYTSGRLPVDMTMKAIRAGVPILASKALPTDKAVELAKTYHLTLIGAAHPDSMQIFS